MDGGGRAAREALNTMKLPKGRLLPEMLRITGLPSTTAALLSVRMLGKEHEM